jgi:hypothetical protein
MSVDVEAETARWLATMSPEETQRAIDYTHGSHWLILGGFVVSVHRGLADPEVGIAQWPECLAQSQAGPAKCDGLRDRRGVLGRELDPGPAVVLVVRLAA